MRLYSQPQCRVDRFAFPLIVAVRRRARDEQPRVAALLSVISAMTRSLEPEVDSCYRRRVRNNIPFLLSRHLKNDGLANNHAAHLESV